MTASPRPYVRCAILCERALIERDGTPSLIRVTDQVFVAPRALDQPPAQHRIRLTLLLSLIAGKVAQGVHPLFMHAERPSGERFAEQRPSIEFSANHPAETVSLFMDVDVSVSDIGLYWFCVGIDEPDRELVRVPLHLVPMIR